MRKLGEIEVQRNVETTESTKYVLQARGSSGWIDYTAFDDVLAARNEQRCLNGAIAWRLIRRDFVTTVTEQVLP